MSPASPAPPRLSDGHRQPGSWWLLAAYAVLASTVVLGWAGLGDPDRLYREAGHELRSPLVLSFRLWLQGFGLWVLLGLLGPRLAGTWWRWTRSQQAVFAGWALALLAGGQWLHWPHPKARLRAYCEGVSQVLEQRVGHGEVRRRMENLSQVPDPEGLGFLRTNAFPEVSRGESQTVLLSPTQSKDHPRASMFFRIAGGAVMLSADGPPKNPGRGGDQDLHWTNDLWVSTRFE
ncbi:MAG: hypothetical protein J0L84_02710 [Verrucomicrobia bacterium]|nr:hypothetical protein [Verrucomicrobiota bacterium]